MSHEAKISSLRPGLQRFLSTSGMAAELDAHCSNCQHEVKAVRWFQCRFSAVFLLTTKMVIRDRQRSRLSARIINIVLCFVSICIFIQQQRKLDQILASPVPPYNESPHDTFKAQIHVKGEMNHSYSPHKAAVHTCMIRNRTVSIPMAPHFIIAGAQKSGTTALMHFLQEHPNIKASILTETHFFDWHYPSDAQMNEWLKLHGYTSRLKPKDLQCAVREQYSKNFNVTENTSPETIFFEKTPSYLFLTKVPELISSICVWKPKIVVILRNPIDRAISHFQMKHGNQGEIFENVIDEELLSLRRTGLSKAPLRTAPFNPNDRAFEIPRMSKEQSEASHWKHYRRMFNDNLLQRGMYATQLSHWTRFFPLGESMLVLNYERFKSHPQEVFSELLRFVGASPFVPEDGFQTIHNGRGPIERPMAPETRTYLTAFYRPYNRQLTDLLGDSWEGVWDS